MKKVICIVGPTSSGKTALSIAVAKKFNLEIINGDSVQVYQGLNIGSAKIKEEEKEGIKHHLLDHISPKFNYSVYHFQKDVRKLIDSLNVPIIVGGTGLYIKAALYDYEFTEDGRSLAFENELKDQSTEEIYNKLLEIDPDVKVDEKNRRRVIRAYEQALLGSLRSQKNAKDQLLYDALIIYLDVDRKDLEQRLIKRLDQQLKDGFIEEVKGLIDQDIHINVIGYREIERYLLNQITLEETKQEIIKVSKRLAKKQKTWFKNQMNPIILDANSQTLNHDVFTLIEEFLKKEN